MQLIVRRLRALPAIEAAIIRHEGNLSAVADELRVPAADLRRAVAAVPMLYDVWKEARERVLDKAEAVIREGLRHESGMVRLEAAEIILHRSKAARRRGWGTRRK